MLARFCHAETGLRIWKNVFAGSRDESCSGIIYSCGTWQDMRASFLEKLNEYPVVRDTPEPVPGPDEVVIRQKLTGICYRDILTMEGFFPRVRLPIIPGHEITGTIVSVGERVTGFSVGDRVSSLIYVPCGECRYCRSGNTNLCQNKQTYGETINGSYAEYISVNSRGLVKVPEKVDDESAALSACVTGMIYHALVRVGRIQKGETLLVTGAGGGVGIHAVQIGKALGARVIAESSSPWKDETILKYGAEAVVRPDNMDQLIKKEYGGSDVVIETVGIPTFERSFKSLSPGGRIVLIGNVSPAAFPLPLGVMILKGTGIFGSISSTKEDMKEAMQLVSAGKLKAVEHEKVFLEDVPKAYREMKSKSNLGRIFIKLA